MNGYETHLYNLLNVKFLSKYWIVPKSVCILITKEFQDLIDLGLNKNLPANIYLRDKHITQYSFTVGVFKLSSGFKSTSLSFNVIFYIQFIIYICTKGIRQYFDRYLNSSGRYFGSQDDIF